MTTDQPHSFDHRLIMERIARYTDKLRQHKDVKEVWLLLPPFYLYTEILAYFILNHHTYFINKHEDEIYRWLKREVSVFINPFIIAREVRPYRKSTELLYYYTKSFDYTMILKNKKLGRINHPILKRLFTGFFNEEVDYSKHDRVKLDNVRMMKEEIIRLRKYVESLMKSRERI